MNPGWVLIVSSCALKSPVSRLIASPPWGSSRDLVDRSGGKAPIDVVDGDPAGAQVAGHHGDPGAVDENVETTDLPCRPIHGRDHCLGIPVVGFDRQRLATRARGASAVSLARSALLTYVSATCAPSRARRRTMAAPIPRLPPVTSARRSR